MSWWMIHGLAFANAFGMVLLLVGIDRCLRSLERRWKRTQTTVIDLAPEAPTRRVVKPVIQAPAMCSRLVHAREGWHAR